MKVLWTILFVVVFFAVLSVTVFFCNKYVFRRFKVNKYIPLGLAILTLIPSFFIGGKNIVINILITFFSILFFVWFFDIQQNGEAKNKKNIKIRPKAKPNRVLNKNKIEKK